VLPHHAVDLVLARAEHLDQVAELRTGRIDDMQTLELMPVVAALRQLAGGQLEVPSNEDGGGFPSAHALESQGRDPSDPVRLRDPTWLDVPLEIDLGTRGEPFRKVRQRLNLQGARQPLDRGDSGDRQTLIRRR
jgi:hypothetical protein